MCVMLWDFVLIKNENCVSKFLCMWYENLRVVNFVLMYLIFMCNV